MGFWNGNVENSFDRLFDLNGDGKLDIGEQVFQFIIISREMEAKDHQEQEDEGSE